MDINRLGQRLRLIEQVLKQPTREDVIEELRRQIEVREELKEISSQIEQQQKIIHPQPPKGK
jgi:hypothetical protein